MQIPEGIKCFSFELNEFNEDYLRISKCPYLILDVVNNIKFCAYLNTEVDGEKECQLNLGVE